MDKRTITTAMQQVSLRLLPAVKIAAKQMESGDDADGRRNDATVGEADEVILLSGAIYFQHGRLR